MTAKANSPKIEKLRIGNRIYEVNEKGILLSLKRTYKSKCNRWISINKLLLQKSKYKKRGAQVVKPETKEIWNRLIDNTIRKDNSNCWYEGAIIEAALTCMEELSSGKSIEDTYKLIDVQNPSKSAISCNMILSEPQNKEITNIIGGYSRYGEAFCKYRNKYVADHSSKVKKRNEK